MIVANFMRISMEIFFVIFAQNNARKTGAFVLMRRKPRLGLAQLLFWRLGGEGRGN